MRVQAERVREWFRTSLAVVPCACAAVAILGAQSLTRVDRGLEQGRVAWWLFGGTASSAEQLLSTIASSLMQFTAVVFSITILVLQLASSQFSPRVLRTFLEDRQTQWTMGIFIGSFVYATTLLLHVRVQTREHPEFVPALSIFVAFVLVLLSVVSFVRYIQNMAHTIRAVNLVYRVAEETRQSMEQLYPESTLNEPAENTSAPTEPPEHEYPHDRPPGVVTRINEKALMKLACRHQVIIGLVPQIGDFLPRGTALFRIWGNSSLTLADLRLHVVVAFERTPHQDPAFGFRQLVDIAERALSPGVNDPTTAVQALDQLHDLLRNLSRRHIPSPYRVDDQQRLRLILPRPGWESYVHLAVDEIRQYGHDSIQVVRRLRGMLDDLLACVPAHRRAPLEQQVQMVSRQAHQNFQGLDEDYAARGNADGNG